jgi:hypothetical protein
MWKNEVKRYSTLKHMFNCNQTNWTIHMIYISNQKSIITTNINKNLKTKSWDLIVKIQCIGFWNWFRTLTPFYCCSWDQRQCWLYFNVTWPWYPFSLWLADWLIDWLIDVLLPAQELTIKVHFLEVWFKRRKINQCKVIGSKHYYVCIWYKCNDFRKTKAQMQWIIFLFF